MITYCNKLTKKIKEKYIDKQGILKLVYNSTKNAFVIDSKRHIEMVLNILNKDIREIARSPYLASHLIPITMLFNEDEEVQEVIAGYSSVELNYKIMHFKKDIKKVNNAILRFVRNYQEKDPKIVIYNPNFI